MQVQPQPHQEIVDNKKTQQSFVLQQGADLSIDESLLREGVGPYAAITAGRRQVTQSFIRL